MADSILVLKAYRVVNPQRFAYGTATQHVCTNRCEFWEHRPTTSFVCVRALMVHECGARCNEYIQTEEFEVCRLTGRVIGNIADVHHWHRKGRNVTQSHSMPAKHTSLKVLKADRLRKAAESAIIALFAVTARLTIRAGQRRRLRAIALKSVRKSHCFATWYVTVASNAVVNSRQLQQPTTDNKTVRALAARIGAYVVKFAVHLKTTNAAVALAAAVLDRMIVGYVVKGATVIPRIPFVAMYAPRPLDHSTLLNLRCRAVSSANRLLATKTVSAGGGPLSGMIFLL